MNEDPTARRRASKIVMRPDEVVLSIALSSRELDELREAAAAEGGTLAELVRKRLFGREYDAPVERSAEREGARLGGRLPDPHAPRQRR